MPCGSCWTPVDPPDCCEPGEPFCDALGIMRSVSMTAAPKSIESIRPSRATAGFSMTLPTNCRRVASSSLVNYRRL